MPTVAFLHHLDPPYIGHAERPLRDAGVEVLHCSVPDGELPDLADVDGLVVFGGEQSATDVQADPALAAEVELLAGAVEAGVPVLGLCLGGQLLASALGATVRRAPRRTVAWRELEPLPGAEDDAIVAALPERVPALHWNEDVFSLPDGAVELLGPRHQGVEAFRAGRCAYGLQFHPEVDGETLDRWYDEYGAWLGEAGVSEADARARDAANEAAQADSAQRLFTAFARLVERERAARSSA